ncbi:MAG: hypothetical protein AAF989_15430 [Planctomycetota bacterium]
MHLSTEQSDDDPKDWIVRIGSLGEILVATDAPTSGNSFARDTRVLLRTHRGVELGAIIRQIPANASSTNDRKKPAILRATTAQDELLIDRLSQYKREAVEACRDAILKADSSVTLLDVDHLFDGGTLILHFLGEVPPLIEDLTQQIVRRYEGIVRSADLASAIELGCGPGCGSKDSPGCSGQCAGCAIKDACRPRPGG